MGRLTKHFILRNMVIIIVLLAKPSIHFCFGHKAQVGSTLSSQKIALSKFSTWMGPFWLPFNIGTQTFHTHQGTKSSLLPIILHQHEKKLWRLLLKKACRALGLHGFDPAASDEPNGTIYCRSWSQWGKMLDNTRRCNCQAWRWWWVLCSLDGRNWLSASLLYSQSSGEGGWGTNMASGFSVVNY